MRLGMNESGQGKSATVLITYLRGVVQGNGWVRVGINVTGKTGLAWSTNYVR